MRTLLIGLIGGALVFTFFWYRGDVGVITLPILGELVPPAAAQSPTPGLMDRLATVRPEARAIRARFAPREELVDLTTAPEVYAGQLIAKPREPSAADTAAAAAPALSEAELAGRLTARAMRALRADAVSAPLAASNAVRIANEVGVVDATPGGALLINIDYDLMDEVEQQVQTRAVGDAVRGLANGLALQSTVAPDADAAARSLGAAVRALTDARPLAFNAGEAVRDAAMRSQARRLQWAPTQCPENVDAAYLRANPQVGVSCAIERLRASGEFEYVEPNLIVTHEMARKPGPTVGVTGPNDPHYAFQWNYRSQGAGEGQSQGGASFADFWTRARQQGSRDVVVAVIDTGLDMTHPDIARSPNLAPGIDLVSVEFYANDGDGRDRDPSDPGDICDPSDPTAEDSFHGTHVAGTIGAAVTNNGEGIAGGAWNVTIVPIRAMGRCGGLQSDINDAIRWAVGVPVFIETGGDRVETVINEHPADIINLSLGFRAPNGCPRSTQEAINDAIAAGAIVVAAAGNAGINVDGYGPSGCEGVVTVAAGDALGALAYYSNWGDKVDIMAPGGDLRVDLDEDGRPDGILSAKRVRGECVDPVTGAPIGGCNYAYENGTSMAAPHVSAALALLKSQDPARSNESLISLLVGQARRPRSLAQCTGPCGETPGGTVIDGQPGLCHRACGQGLLDLSLAVGQ